MQTLDVQSASRLANCQLTEAAYYFPLGGWVDGSLLCDTYLEHPSIDLITDQVVSSLKQNNNQWQLLGKEQKEIARAPIVVIANSYNASQFQQTHQLPLTTLPGQTSVISATDQSLSLATVVCGNRTVFPAIGNHHNLSASYRREDARLELRPDDDQQNLAGARACFRGDYLSQVIQSARVTVRCNSKDNFPVVGKVPNVSKLQDHSMLGGHYGQIGKISNDYYLPGLYITAAHGSNGLATCPLSSEYLASLIDQEVPPFGQGIIGALDPARFIIREIRKKR
jgi:tRNA 5-methylaminomethyl-2-thiouridine biosynthesis bifunctional protein